MRFLCKTCVALAVMLFAFAAVPAVKADPIVINTGGFQLFGLGNDGAGITTKDTLLGDANTRNIITPGNVNILLNPLTFITGFTGPNSGGPHEFNFSQLLTINGQTQTLNLVGRIDIDHLVDTVHILSGTPLTFNFTDFSVVLTVLPTEIEGWGEGVFCGDLKARLEVKTGAAVPEPATLTLLGLGLAGVAAKMRQRHRSRKSAAA